LNAYGFKLANARQWKEAPKDSGLQVRFSVDEHISRAGHTWYNVKCKLSGMPNEVGCIDWVAPRRLGQLRVDLHHRVKHALGSEIYEEKFENSRFAKYGGPSGTTARLNAWLGVLATLINEGVADPSVAVIALVFFSTPIPEGVAVPAIEKGLLRIGGDVRSLDNHSQLGGQPQVTF